jgi:hypothetical protein
MNAALRDEAMTAQLSLEWERFKKALSQAGDIGSLNLDEWRISTERDRRAVPPVLSVASVQSLLKLEKSGLRGQAIRAGEETKDPTQRSAAEAQSAEIRIQDADHSEAYAVVAYHGGTRLGLNPLQALVFGDAMAYLLTGWGQTHTDGHYTDRLAMEFKKIAGSAPEGGFLWKDLHSLACRKGFQKMVERARLIGTPLFK